MEHSKVEEIVLDIRERLFSEASLLTRCIDKRNIKGIIHKYYITPLRFKKINVYTLQATLLVRILFNSMLKKKSKVIVKSGRCIDVNKYGFLIGNNFYWEDFYSPEFTLNPMTAQSKRG